MPKKTDLEVKDLATAEAAFAKHRRHTTVTIERRVHRSLPLEEQLRIRVRALPSSHPLSSTHREVHQVAQDRGVYATTMREVRYQLRGGTLPRMAEVVYAGLPDEARTLLITEYQIAPAIGYLPYRLVIGTHPDTNDSRVRYVSSFAEILDVLDQGLRAVIHQTTAHANISPRVRASLITTPWVNNYVEVTGLVRDKDMLDRTVEYVNNYREAFEALCRGERPVLSRWYFEERMSQETRLALVYGNYGNDWVEIIDDPRRPEIAASIEVEPIDDQSARAAQLSDELRAPVTVERDTVLVKTFSQIEDWMPRNLRVLITSVDLQRLDPKHRSRLRVVPYTEDPEIMHIVEVTPDRSARAVQGLAETIERRGRAIISPVALERITMEHRKRLTLMPLLTGNYAVTAVRPVDGPAEVQVKPSTDPWVKTPEEAAQRFSQGLKVRILRDDFLKLSMEDRRRFAIQSSDIIEGPMPEEFYNIRRTFDRPTPRVRVVKHLTVAERALEQGYNVLIANDVLDTWTPENRERVTTATPHARLTRFLPNPEVSYSEIIAVRPKGDGPMGPVTQDALHPPVRVETADRAAEELAKGHRVEIMGVVLRSLPDADHDRIRTAPYPRMVTFNAGTHYERTRPVWDILAVDPEPTALAEIDRLIAHHTDLLHKLKALRPLIERNQK